MSRNNYLSDIKELVQKKLLLLLNNIPSYEFLYDKGFCGQIKSLKSEKFTLNILNENHNLKFQSSFFDKLKQLLKKKLENAGAKEFSINSDCFENINYDKQNNLFNLNIENEACFFVELTDEKNTTILNSDKNINYDYLEGDCSICFNRKILFHNCRCGNVN